jgi:hypothetical protein
MSEKEQQTLRSESKGVQKKLFKTNIYFPTREVGDNTAVIGIKDIGMEVSDNNKYKRAGGGTITLVTDRAKRVDQILKDVSSGKKLLKTSDKGGEGVNSITSDEFTDILDAVRLKEIPLTRANVLFKKFNDESVLVNNPMIPINPSFGKNSRSMKTVLPQLAVLNQLENNPIFAQRLTLELSRFDSEEGKKGIAGRRNVKLDSEYSKLTNPSKLTPAELTKSVKETLDLVDAEKMSPEASNKIKDMPPEQIFNFFSRTMRQRREEAKKLRETIPVGPPIKGSRVDPSPKTATEAMAIMNRVIAKAEEKGLSIDSDEILGLEKMVKSGDILEDDLLNQVERGELGKKKLFEEKFPETPVYDESAKVNRTGVDLSGVKTAIDKANAAGVGELAGDPLFGKTGGIPPVKAKQFGGIGGESHIRARFRQRRPFFIHYGTGLITETPEKQAEDADAFANFNWIPEDGNFEDGSDNVIVKSQKFNDALRYGVNWVPEVPKQRKPLNKTIMSKLEIPMVRDIQNNQKMTEYEDGANFGIIKLFPVNPVGNNNMFDKLENRLIFPSMVDGERV